MNWKFIMFIVLFMKRRRTMKIAIINGRGTSGKTTFETMVKKVGKARDYNIEIVSTIDYVKDKARTFGWDGGKSPEDRRFLSDLKDALTRWGDIPY
jgi:CO dehydrogenase nickel-insertion accessory protein CooC1